jgi:hypothetical protein
MFRTIFLSAAVLLATASAAPAIERRQINNDDVPGTPVGPAQAMGKLLGGRSLLGVGDYSATPGTTATGSLVAGQTASASLGLYLDFTQAQAPQPFRGEDGGTDPGPRRISSCGERGG